MLSSVIPLISGGPLRYDDTWEAIIKDLQDLHKLSDCKGVARRRRVQAVVITKREKNHDWYNYRELMAVRLREA